MKRKSTTQNEVSKTQEIDHGPPTACIRFWLVPAAAIAYCTRFGYVIASRPEVKKHCLLSEAEIPPVGHELPANLLLASLSRPISDSASITGSSRPFLARLIRLFWAFLQPAAEEHYEHRLHLSWIRLPAYHSRVPASVFFVDMLGTIQIAARKRVPDCLTSKLFLLNTLVRLRCCDRFRRVRLRYVDGAHSFH
jgi:hypothetical protein